MSQTAPYRAHRCPYRIVLFLAVLVSCCCIRVPAQELYKPGDAPFAVDVSRLELRDADRDRDIPIKVYAPVADEGARPVVIISHGLGGNREGLEYIGRFWAGHGYVCVHIQHLGSDEAVWKGVPVREAMAAMRRAAANPVNAVNRARDVTFVLDIIEQANGRDDGPLHGHYDMEKVAIVGHSFGAWTCLAAGGMTLGTGASLGDERIKCMIPLSSPAETNPRRQDRAYGSIKIPALHMTGTLDESAINDTTPAQRRIPYDHTPGPADGGAPQYLIIFDGADHMTFSGETNRRLTRIPAAKNAKFHAVIRHAGLAFLDAYLLGSGDAKAWLEKDGMRGVVEPIGAVEIK